VMKGIKKNNLYSLIGRIVVGSVSIVKDRKLSKKKIWHARACQREKGFLGIQQTRSIRK